MHRRVRLDGSLPTLQPPRRPHTRHYRAHRPRPARSVVPACTSLTSTAEAQDVRIRKSCYTALSSPGLQSQPATDAFTRTRDRANSPFFAYQTSTHPTRPQMAHQSPYRPHFRACRHRRSLVLRSDVRSLSLSGEDRHHHKRTAPSVPSSIPRQTLQPSAPSTGPSSVVHQTAAPSLNMCSSLTSLLRPATQQPHRTMAIRYTGPAPTTTCALDRTN